MKSLRTLVAVPAGLVALVGAIGIAGSAPAGAQDEAPDDAGSCPEVRVVEVTGLLDDVLASFVERSIAEADDCGAVAVVLQLDSPGAVVSDERMDQLVTAIEEAEVPVTVWVGPSGAAARDEAFRLVQAADVAALAPNSRLQAPGGPSIGSEQAVEQDLTDFGGRQAATLGDFIVSLSDHDVPVQVRVVEVDGSDPRREPVTRTRFSSLSLVDQLAHTVSSPPVAYLLFTIGMALLLFEFFTAGVGVAGLVGASFFLAGGYGLAALPTNPVGVGLLVFAMFGFGVDIQTGVPRVWTVIASVSLPGRLPGALRRAVAVVDHAAHLGPRHGPGHGGGHAGHGPEPLLHAHHRSGVDGGRGRDRTHRGRPGRRGAGPRRSVAGPHQPCHAHRRRAIRCASPRSTGCCSRSSRSRARHVTTVSAGRTERSLSDRCAVRKNPAYPFTGADLREYGPESAVERGSSGE